MDSNTGTDQSPSVSDFQVYDRELGVIRDVRPDELFATARLIQATGLQRLSTVELQVMQETTPDAAHRAKIAAELTGRDVRNI